MATNRETLYNLFRMFPHRDGDGHMYSDRKTKNRPTNGMTLYVYMRSGEGTNRLHESDFVLGGGKVRTPKEWADWIYEKVLSGSGSGTPAQRDGILAGSIIPGMEIKTSTHWTVVRVIGFSTHDVQ